VIALSPSGLMDNYWRVVKRAKGTIVVLTDDAANIWSCPSSVRLILWPENRVQYPRFTTYVRGAIP